MPVPQGSISGPHPSVLVLELPPGRFFFAFRRGYADSVRCSRNRSCAPAAGGGRQPGFRCSSRTARVLVEVAPELVRTLSFRSLRGLAVCDPRRAGSVSGYGAESRHHLDRWKSLTKIMLDSRLEHVPVAAISLEDLIGVVGIVRIPRAIGRVSNMPVVDRHSAPRRKHEEGGVQESEGCAVHRHVGRQLKEVLSLKALFK